MARIVCKIFGVLFIVIGSIVILRGAPVDKYHNLLHLATGVVAAGLGFFGSKSGAKNFCVGFGAFYLAFGVLGLVLGDPALDRMWHVGPLHLNTGDHLFHVVLGSILLTSGFFTRRATVRPVGTV